MEARDSAPILLVLPDGLADDQPIRTISSEADLLHRHHAISTHGDDDGNDDGNGDEVLVWVYILGEVGKREQAGNLEQLGSPVLRE
jgi:hypothetical protein